MGTEEMEITESKIGPVERMFSNVPTVELTEVQLAS
jgi:hypothetical protein